MNNKFSPLYIDVDIDNLSFVKESDIVKLPEPVKRCLLYTGIIGKKEIKTVYLKQKGVFRQKVDSKWIPTTAEQYINVDAMGFIWKAKTSVIRVIDQFVNGNGRLNIKLFGLLKIGDFQGLEVDQGEALRFLTESIWFPSAFTKEYLVWTEIDSHTADVTLLCNTPNVTARFYFRKSGEVEKITAKRYMEDEGKFSLNDWVISNLEYKYYSGVRIPYKAHVSWGFKDMIFCYYKLEMTEVSFNGCK